MESGFPKLSDSEVQRLDALDRVARQNARRAGHTHELAKMPAKRADGSIVGRVSA